AYSCRGRAWPPSRKWMSPPWSASVATWRCSEFERYDQFRTQDLAGCENEVEARSYPELLVPPRAANEPTRIPARRQALSDYSSHLPGLSPSLHGTPLPFVQVRGRAGKQGVRT